ncbi:hypothetical protein SLA2020_367900 [Shorea laevis]
MATAAALSGTMVSTSFVRRQPVTSLRSLPSVGQALFGVKGGRGGRITAMAVHKIKLITPEGPQEFDCPDDVYILDQAEELVLTCRTRAGQGLALPAPGKLWKGAWISLTVASSTMTRSARGGSSLVLLTRSLIL